MATNDPVTEFATKAFGIPYLYPYQRLVIANVLDAITAHGDGTDRETERQVVILPTGAGKSLCFQVPAGLCPGPTLVVYPLLGLMADQKRRLEQTGMGVAVLRGGMSAEEREAAFGAVLSGAARIVIANPEMLAVPRVLEFLKTAGIFHFVIDEAHCVAEWGDGFRPAYLGLGDAIRSVRPRVVTAFTATASPAILARLAEALFAGDPYRLVAGAPDRPNIRYEVRPALSMIGELRRAVSTMPRPMIVFAPSRPGVEIAAEDLRATFPGIDSRFYHAGLEKSERAALETWFMASNSGVLCATCAYGMGMDKPDIRTVVHYGPPASVEAYLQESGRAGRDGGQSFAVLLRKAAAGDYCYESHGDTETPGVQPEPSIQADRSAIMKAYACGDYGCRRTFLLSALGYEEAEAVACPSCDRCDGEALTAARGSDAVKAVARSQARRFSAREAAAFAVGTGGSRGASPKAAYWGCLGDWRPDEAEDAFENGVRAGLIRRVRWGPWKGALYAPGGYQSGRISSSSIVSSAAGAGVGAFFAALRAAFGILCAFSRHGSATYRMSSQNAMKAPSVAKTSHREITANASVSLSMMENVSPIPASVQISSDASSHA